MSGVVLDLEAAASVQYRRSETSRRFQIRKGLHNVFTDVDFPFGQKRPEQLEMASDFDRFEAKKKKQNNR